MKIEDALKPGVTPAKFFVDYVPALFKARRELFAEVSDVDVIASVYMRDVDERYTCEFRADGCTVERDEMVDFPVATIVGDARDWEDFKRHLLGILVLLEQRAYSYRNDPAKPAPSRLTRDFVDKLERFDGVFSVQLSAEGLQKPIAIQLVLNDYEAGQDAPLMKLAVSFETMEQFARGAIDPKQLGRHVRVGGEVSLGLELGGLLLKYFPELETAG